LETIRAWVEGFLRGRYGLAELGPRAFRVLVAPVLVVAILAVAGWLLFGTLTIPRFSTDGPVVRNGVAVIVACGKKRSFMEALENVPEPRTGTWGIERRGACNVYYHHPPDATQRFNRHQRAATLSGSGEMRGTEGLRRSTSEFQRLPVVEKLPHSP
jgi:hypothetical protein